MGAKDKHLLITFSAGLVLTQSLILMSHIQPAHAEPGILYVALDGNDSNDCVSASNRCRTIQQAVDVALPNDEIRVASGTYTGVETREGISQIVFINKTVTIRGGYTTTSWAMPDPVKNLTKMDAQGVGRVIVIKNSGPTIEGFSITGGNGYYSGGGINVESGSPIIYGNTITENSADGDGGGIFINRGSAQITNNHIIGNSAVWAGGLRIINNADVTIVGNRIENNIAQVEGGGIFVDCCGGTTPLIAQNYILNNNGGAKGGGVSVESTHAKLVNNILAGNLASKGAGIYLEGSASHPVTATLFHNTIIGGQNEGEAIWGGQYVTSSLVNNIIDNHTTGIANSDPANSTLTANYTLFNDNDTDYGSGVNSTNGLNGNPAFVNPGNGNYHIGPYSMAIDKGVDAGVIDDIDDSSRPRGTGYDIGADEYVSFSWLMFLPGITSKKE